MSTAVDDSGRRVEKGTSEMKYRKVWGRQMVSLECLLRRKKNWIHLHCNNELQLITMRLEGMDNGMGEAIQSRTRVGKKEKIMRVSNELRGWKLC